MRERESEYKLTPLPENEAVHHAFNAVHGAFNHGAELPNALPETPVFVNERGEGMLRAATLVLKVRQQDRAQNRTPAFEDPRMR